MTPSKNTEHALAEISKLRTPGVFTDEEWANISDTLAPLLADTLTASTPLAAAAMMTVAKRYMKQEAQKGQL